MDQEEGDDNASATSSISSGDNGSSPCRPRNYGSLDKSQTAFLKGKPLYLLFYWEIIATHQLFQSLLRRLTCNIGAGDASMALC
jgi:hypothetical protein